MIQLIYKDHKYKARAFTISKPIAVGLSLATLILGISIAYLGFDVGSRYAYSSTLNQPQIKAWQEQLKQHQELALKAKRESILNVAALQKRVASLQSHIIRLNALGQRLVDIARVDSKEFNFVLPPPLGGPEENHVELDVDKNNYSDFIANLEAAESTLKAHDRKLLVLENFYRNSENIAETYVNGKPVQRGWVSSYFGKRTDPFHGRKSWHSGIDIAGRENSKIIAVASGVVTWASSKSGYGKLVEIDHGNGYVTRYAHANKITVKTGDIIDKGQSIALMGSTGRSTGPHVHFEVLRNGKHVNPQRYLRRSKIN